MLKKIFARLIPFLLAVALMITLRIAAGA